MSDEERKELGVERRVPTDLISALKALQSDTELATCLGQPVVDKYAVMKKSELDRMDTLKEEGWFEWEVERY